MKRLGIWMGLTLTVGFVLAGCGGGQKTGEAVIRMVSATPRVPIGAKAGWTTALVGQRLQCSAPDTVVDAACSCYFTHFTQKYTPDELLVFENDHEQQFEQEAQTALQHCMEMRRPL